MPKLRRPQPDEEYALADQPADDRAVAEYVRRRELESDQREPEAGPRQRSPMEWNLFLGGFGFPWSRGAAGRWGLISVLAIIALWLARSAFGLGIGGALPAGGGLGMIGSVLAGVLAGLGAGLFALVCASLAAVHGLAILTETSDGNDRIESWPELGTFLDWLGNLLYVFNAATLCVALGIALHWLVPGGRATIIGIETFFVFPLLLLCELEANSAFMPASRLVLATLWRRGLSWLLFYAQSGCLLVAFWAILLFVVPRIGAFLGIVLSGSLFAAVVMIYFRLLGRLAWFCSIETDEEAAERERAEQDEA